jgi:putative Holliday junction resolvase
VTRYLGVDCGTKRVGVAVSDAAGILASPLEVVSRAEAVDRLAELASDHQVGGLVVGLPTSLSGEEGRSAEDARRFGAELGAATGLPVVFVDERFTSRIAEEALIESGKRRRERRGAVDKAAAALLLQGFLDGLAKRGTPGQADTF